MKSCASCAAGKTTKIFSAHRVEQSWYSSTVETRNPMFYYVSEVTP